MLSRYRPVAGHTALCFGIAPTAPPAAQAAGIILPPLAIGPGPPLNLSLALTLLDSIMPVLAWNLTVFNRALSFFSTLIGS